MILKDRRNTAALAFAGIGNAVELFCNFIVHSPALLHPIGLFELIRRESRPTPTALESTPIGNTFQFPFDFGGLQFSKFTCRKAARIVPCLM